MGRPSWRQKRMDQVGRGSEHSAALEGSVPGPRLTARLQPRPQLPPPAPVPPLQGPVPNTRLPRCPLSREEGGRTLSPKDQSTGIRRR
ncbi:unnamed protein product [Rangifer tarandus platyrhynchus]|uniref:Uncharacterized protein n=1 Tax=Rangifer tarandus platyrhynchus TaxID=3082113 RepID=A0AC60AA61_RANTA